MIKLQFFYLLFLCFVVVCIQQIYLYNAMKQHTKKKKHIGSQTKNKPQKCGFYLEKNFQQGRVVYFIIFKTPRFFEPPSPLFSKLSRNFFKPRIRLFSIEFENFLYESVKSLSIISIQTKREQFQGVTRTILEEMRNVYTKTSYLNELIDRFIQTSGTKTNS